MSDELNTTGRPDVVIKVRTINYQAVFAGVICSLALLLLASVLGDAIHLSMLRPSAREMVPLDTGTILWTLFVPAACFALGGLISSASSRVETAGQGALQGLLVWGLGLLFLTVLIAVRSLASGAVEGGALGGAELTARYWLGFFALCMALMGAVLGGSIGTATPHKVVIQNPVYRREV